MIRAERVIISLVSLSCLIWSAPIACRSRVNHDAPDIMKIGLDELVRVVDNWLGDRYSTPQSNIQVSTGSALNLPTIYGTEAAFQSSSDFVESSTSPLGLTDREWKNTLEDDTTCYQCAICLEALKLDLGIIKLKCNHQFHISCITCWARSDGNTCPLCRSKLLLENDEVLLA